MGFNMRRLVPILVIGIMAGGWFLSNYYPIESSRPVENFESDILVDLNHDRKRSEIRHVGVDVSESESLHTVEYSKNEAVVDRSVPLAIRIDDYMELARNDASAAHDLATTIASCAALRFPEQTTQALLDEGQDDLRRLNIASALLDMKDYCAGLSKSDFITALQLIDTTAAKGFIKAQVGYIDVAGMVLANDEFLFDSERIADYKVKAVRYLHSAAKNGSSEAYQRLAFAYADGVIVDENPALALAFYTRYMEESGIESDSAMAMLEQLEARAGVRQQ